MTGFFGGGGGGGVNADFGAFAGGGLGAEGMAEVFADAAAQVQADAAGALIRAAVMAGEAFFEDARQVLRGDADAAIPHDDGFRRFHADHHAALRRIFQRVGENLLDDEGEPFFVRERGFARRFIQQTDFAVDEFSGEFARGLPQNGVESAFADHVIRRAAVEPLIGHRHGDVLLHAEKIGRQSARKRRILALQAQAHCGDGRFNLMRPGGVVIGHIGLAGGCGVFLRAQLFAQRADDRLIIRLGERRGGGKALRERFGGHAGQARERFVLCARAEVIDSQPHRADSGAQRRRIRRRSDRQLIQRERRAEKRREQRRRAKQRPALPQILREFHRYPT